MPNNAGTSSDISYIVHTGSSIYRGTSGTGRDDALISLTRDITFPFPQLPPSPATEFPPEQASPAR